MLIPLWTKFAAVALVAGSAFAWSTGPSAAQPFPGRTVVIDGQTEQVVQVRHHRRHVREHRRWHRDRRHRHVRRHRHRDRFVTFGVAVPYVVAPPAVYAAPPVVAPTPCGSAVSVRPGDTLARIAARCGTTVGALLSANPQIYNPHVIYAGQVIRMPWG